MASYGTNRAIAARRIEPGEPVCYEDWLMPHELYIINLLTCETSGMKQLAFLLGCTENTLKSRFAIIYRKVGVHDLTSLLKWAIKHGVVKVNNERELKGATEAGLSLSESAARIAGITSPFPAARAGESALGAGAMGGEE